MPRSLSPGWTSKPIRSCGGHEFHSWLAERDSLTRRLRTAATRFNVVLIRQALAMVHPEEQQLLGVRRNTRVWVREVLLRDDRRTLVYAHTVWPRATRNRAWRSLDGLGPRPLGEYLFQHPGIQRSALSFRRLPRLHPLTKNWEGRFREATNARRATFIYHGQPLLVTEIFVNLP